MKDRYITIKGWMIDDLKLTGTDLLCYATIYNFSQPNEKNKTVGEWNGTTQELADWVGCTKRQVIKTLQQLTEKGLIQPTHEITKNGRLKTKCYVALVNKIHHSWGTKFTNVGEQNSPTDPCSLNKDIKNKKVNAYASDVAFAPSSAPAPSPFSSIVNKTENELTGTAIDLKANRQKFALCSELLALMGQDTVKPGLKLKSAITARLKEGYSELDLKEIARWARTQTDDFYKTPHSLFSEAGIAGAISKMKQSKPTNNFDRRTL